MGGWLCKGSHWACLQALPISPFGRLCKSSLPPDSITNHLPFLLSLLLSSEMRLAHSRFDDHLRRCDRFCFPPLYNFRPANPQLGGT